MKRIATHNPPFANENSDWIKKTKKGNAMTDRIDKEMKKLDEANADLRNLNDIISALREQIAMASEREDIKKEAETVQLLTDMANFSVATEKLSNADLADRLDDDVAADLRIDSLEYAVISEAAERLRANDEAQKRESNVANHNYEILRKRVKDMEAGLNNTIKGHQFVAETSEQNSQFLTVHRDSLDSILKRLDTVEAVQSGRDEGLKINAAAIDEVWLREDKLRGRLDKFESDFNVTLNTLRSADRANNARTLEDRRAVDSLIERVDELEAANESSK